MRLLVEGVKALKSHNVTTKLSHIVLTHHIFDFARFALGARLYASRRIWSQSLSSVTGHSCIVFPVMGLTSLSVQEFSCQQASGVNDSQFVSRRPMIKNALKGNCNEDAKKGKTLAALLAHEWKKKRNFKFTANCLYPTELCRNYPRIESSVTFMTLLEKCVALWWIHKRNKSSRFKSAHMCSTWEAWTKKSHARGECFSWHKLRLVQFRCLSV